MDFPPSLKHKGDTFTFDKMILPLVIIIIGLGIAVLFYKTKPKAQKTVKHRQPPRVEVMTAVSGTHRVMISAMGTIVPSREIELKSTLVGEIKMVSREFIPGGLIKSGDLILKIDPADYQLDVKRKKSLLNHASANLALEMGHQDVVREELTLMQSTSSGKTYSDNNLALRKPQLDQARASLETAKVDLEGAQLNLNRTVVQAPFNGLVISTATDVGSQVSPQSTLATFVGTDSYRIETAVPVNRLRWVTLPQRDGEAGSSVKIITNDKAERQGRVTRLTGSLSKQSRLAKILVEVDDPLCLKPGSVKTPLILGSYVSVLIEGENMDDIVPLPRNVVRDNETIWVLEGEKLVIRKIEIIWSDKETVYLGRGIKTGELVILSNLSGVVDGMALSVDLKDVRVPRGE